MRRLRGAFVIAALLVAVAGARPAAAQVFLRADEVLSRTLVNASRATAGAAPLAESPELDALARAQAERMAQRGDIYHNPNLAGDATASGLAWLRVGENVGVGAAIPVIHDAFLASPHHRDNLLFPSYNLIGMGVAPGVGDKTGLIFVAHVFARVGGVNATTVPAPHAAPPVVSPTPPAPSPPMQTPVPAVETPAPALRPSPAPNALVGGVIDSAVRL